MFYLPKNTYWALNRHVLVCNDGLIRVVEVQEVAGFHGAMLVHSHNSVCSWSVWEHTFDIFFLA